MSARVMLLAVPLALLAAGARASAAEPVPRPSVAPTASPPAPPPRPPVPKKLALLEAKRKAAAPSAAERQRLTKALRRRLGKRPPPIVSVRNGWTEERIALERSKDVKIPAAVWSHFLRCHFTNQERPMEMRMVQVLVGAAEHFRKDRIDIVSGYRAPKYNLMLRKKGREVAKKSQHVEGTAVDFRLPGISAPRLLAYVKGLRLGGVGFYPDSGFVHADTGPVRYWVGR